MGGVYYKKLVANTIRGTESAPKNPIASSTVFHPFTHRKDTVKGYYLPPTTATNFTMWQSRVIRGPHVSHHLVRSRICIPCGSALELSINPLPSLSEQVLTNRPQCASMIRPAKSSCILFSLLRDSEIMRSAGPWKPRTNSPLRAGSLVRVVIIYVYYHCDVGAKRYHL